MGQRFDELRVLQQTESGIVAAQLHRRGIAGEGTSFGEISIICGWNFLSFLKIPSARV